MRDFLTELSSVVLERRGGAAEQELSAWERRLGRAAPEELRQLYGRLNGGRFPGDVELLPVGALAGETPEQPVVLGRRSREGELLMMSKGNLARRLGAPVPGWLEPLPDETWVFALREGGSSLKPARTFEGILDRVLPPRETETFGEATFARGISAVEEALADFPSAGFAGEVPTLEIIRARPAPRKPARAKRKPAAARKVPKKAKAKPSPRKKAKAPGRPKRARAKVRAPKKKRSAPSRGGRARKR